MLMPVVPGVAASPVSAALPEIVLPAITLSFKLIAGAPGGAAWLCIVTPGKPLFRRTLPIILLPKDILPGPAAKTPTPAPAPGTPSPLFSEVFPVTVLSNTPYGTFEVALGEGGWEAMVMPQANGLSCTLLPAIR